MPNKDQIFIKDLTVEMSAGIYDHEKAQKQRVIINVTMDVESNAGKMLNSIDDVVSYEGIVNSICKLCDKKHYDLLEELAEEIAVICNSKKQVIKTFVSLEKPDIVTNTKSVGVNIYR